jgi:hypothetical protein
MIGRKTSMISSNGPRFAVNCVGAGKSAIAFAGGCTCHRWLRVEQDVEIRPV